MIVKIRKFFIYCFLKKYNVGIKKYIYNYFLVFKIVGEKKKLWMEIVEFDLCF